MSHDKIKAAARKRMAATGEPYAVARREVIKEHRGAGGEIPASDPQWFDLLFSGDKVTLWMDTLMGGGPGRAGVHVDADELRVRMADFKMTVPRSSVRSVTRTQFSAIGHRRGTTGVHGRRGQWLVNGSADGLVQLAIEPPCTLERQLSTALRRPQVSSLVLSLVDPDGFIAAVERDGQVPSQAGGAREGS